MPAISDLTRSRITATLEVFIENLVERNRGRSIDTMGSPQQYLSLSDKQGSLKPFHAAIVSSEVMRISAFERGLVTSLGTSLEECARLIAVDHHRDAQRGFVLSGEVSSNALSEIEQQVATFERSAKSKTQRPGFNNIVTRVLRANSDGANEPREIIADLYISGYDGNEYFIEMKSPKPNKDQCLRMTQRILLIHALRNSPRSNVKSYMAMAYNPYGNSRDDYRWSITRNYMPFDDSVLIGDEFWNIVGGPTAYEELLEIYQVVGRAKRKYIVEALAFGF